MVFRIVSFAIFITILMSVDNWVNSMRISLLRTPPLKIFFPVDLVGNFLISLIILFLVDVSLGTFFTDISRFTVINSVNCVLLRNSFLIPLPLFRFRGRTFGYDFLNLVCSHTIFLIGTNWRSISGSFTKNYFCC